MKRTLLSISVICIAAIFFAFLYPPTARSMLVIPTVEFEAETEGKDPVSIINDLAKPTKLPSSIEDPALLAGWVYLYNQEETFETWDGSLLSGRKLAQYLLERDIPVQWNTDNHCGGNANSCSGVWGYNGEKLLSFTPKTSPIYISLRYKEKPEMEAIVQIAEIMAHEIFHKTCPFGEVKDTQFEEFWAFNVGANITRTADALFDGFDPYKPACLQLWFIVYDHSFYLEFPSYPDLVLDSVEAETVPCFDVTGWQHTKVDTWLILPTVQPSNINP